MNFEHLDKFINEARTSGKTLDQALNELRERTENINLNNVKYRMNRLLIDVNNKTQGVGMCMRAIGDYSGRPSLREGEFIMYKSPMEYKKRTK